MDPSFAVFRENFLLLYRKISHLTKDDILYKPIQEYIPHFEALMKFGQQQVQIEESIEKHVQSVPQAENTMKKVSQLVYYFNLRCETDAAENIISSTEPADVLKKFPLYESYLRIVQAEVDGAKLAQGDKVVFLGSGPFPISLILFSLYYEIKGVGIERENAAVDISSKLINKLGLQDKITIFSGDHNSFDFANTCKHLIIALDAEPKNEIFEQVSKLPVTTTLSYRISQATKHQFKRQGGSEVLPTSFVAYKTLQVEPPGVGKVIFLRRQPGI